ncbi:MAG: type VI secretion system protein ImpA [Pseudohongiellaceae bacterium]
MDHAELIDIQSVITPISDALPEGKDLRIDISPTSGYQVLRDARTLARNNERAAIANGETRYVATDDWKIIVKQVPQVLTAESKDLELVAWYIEALTRLYGFKGVTVGFSLARQLIETYGGKLHPQPDEDGIATQLAPLTGLNGFGGEGALISPIKSITLTEGSPPGPLAVWQCGQVFEIDRIGDSGRKEARLKETGVSREEFDILVKETDTSFFRNLKQDIAEAIVEYKQYQAAVDDYCPGESLPTGKILEALVDCQQMLIYVAGDRLADDEVPAEVEPGMVSQDDDGDSVNVPEFSKGIRNRSEALALLKKVAEYFRQAEPHSPISYSVDQAVRWSGLPLSELIKELIPDEGARAKYQSLSGIAVNSGN